jgi:hypothetical protein
VPPKFSLDEDAMLSGDSMKMVPGAVLSIAAVLFSVLLS